MTKQPPETVLGPLQPAGPVVTISLTRWWVLNAGIIVAPSPLGVRGIFACQFTKESTDHKPRSDAPVAGRGFGYNLRSQNLNLKFWKAS